METLNIIIIFLIIVVVWLIVKFVLMRKQISSDLNKNNSITTNRIPPITNNISLNSKSKKERNIFFKIKIGNDSEIHQLVFELYDDIVPMTCKNFRILATKGFNNNLYKNSIFHRIIKDFMIQGGDIINQDGTGSISIFGNKFEDENFNLSHDKEGLLSMANSGPNTNGSQFFITTTECKHLDKKHVVFGRVIRGMNVVHKIENLSTDSSGKPYQTVKILDSGIV